MLEAKDISILLSDDLQDLLQAMILLLEEVQPLEKLELFKMVFLKVVSENSSDDQNRIMAETLCEYKTQLELIKR